MHAIWCICNLANACVCLHVSKLTHWITKKGVHTQQDMILHAQASSHTSGAPPRRMGDVAACGALSSDPI